MNNKKTMVAISSTLLLSFATAGAGSALAEGATPTVTAGVKDVAHSSYDRFVDIDVTKNDPLAAGATWSSVQLLDANDNPVDSLNIPEGHVSADELTVTFTPKQGYYGTVSTPVKYIATDSNGNKVVSYINLTVGNARINDKLAKPTAVEDTINVSTTKHTKLDVLKNDKTPAGTKWTKVQFFTENDAPVSEADTVDGHYVVNSDNTIDFAPAKGFNGKAKDPVRYLATNSNNDVSESALTVVGVKDTPKPTPSKTTTPVKPAPSKTTTPAANKPKPVVSKTAKPVVKTSNSHKGAPLGPTVQTDYIK